MKLKSGKTEVTPCFTVILNFVIICLAHFHSCCRRAIKTTVMVVRTRMRR